MVPPLSARRKHERQPMRVGRPRKEKNLNPVIAIVVKTASFIRRNVAGAQAFRRFTTKIIGLVGFEPTASWSRTRRSTKLSHSPN